VIGKINFVVALFCEAKPIITHFNLRKMDSTLFKIYSNQNHSIWLIISSIGSSASSRATKHLALVSEADMGTAWLNIGIGGHDNLPLEKAILAHKITNSSTGKTWFPQLIFDPPCLTTSVKTVEKPDFNYPDDNVVEMEASGFYSAAESYSTREMVHCMKIISDNSQSPAGKITAAIVDKSISRNLSIIKELVRKLQFLSMKEQERTSDPPFLQECLSRWHFTVTQTHQLKSLLRKWLLLQPGKNVLDVLLPDCKDSRNVIQTLDLHLKNTPVWMDHD
jgi:nucleoside phosphorylase